jgi:hypothetical protein
VRLSLGLSGWDCSGIEAIVPDAPPSTTWRIDAWSVDCPVLAEDASTSESAECRRRRLRTPANKCYRGRFGMT